ncbi:MAG: hypothetical protein P1V51_24300 [Deltaproteobacteria bacterium]|nr:hypothetical protein [Deltaproteobacteria bacterium]
MAVVGGSWVRGLLLLFLLGAAPLAHAAEEQRILVMELESDRGVDPALARALQDRVLQQARERGYSVAGESEVVTLLDTEAKQMLLGCTDDPGCLSASANASLEADWLVFGRLTRIGESFDLTLRLAEVRTKRITRQVQQSVPASEADLAETVGPSIAMLLAPPLSAPLDEAYRPPKAWYARPWVWGGAAGAAALGVAAGFLLRPPAAGGALGRVGLDAP